MKKLMIAAAAAAMIGASEAAVEIVYDFTASLKTTAAKAGKGYKDTYKIELANDGADKWWYEDDVFNIDADDGCGYYPGNKGDDGTRKVLTFDKNGIGKLNVSGLKDADKETLATALDAYAKVTKNGKLDHQTGTPEILKGKEHWCASFTYKDEIQGTCYRVAGSKKLQTSYTIDDCCGTAVFTDASVADPADVLKKNDVAVGDLNTVLLYRFGAEGYDKATKVEWAGWIGDSDYANCAQKDTTALPAYSATLPILGNLLHLAGQGTWAVLDKKSGVEGVNSISGSIVGVIPNDQCNLCCGAKNFDLVYDCDGTDDSVTADKAWETVAYGTFTLKVNKKNSSWE